MDLSGMNSSVTPLSVAVQADRPDPWLNWHAAKIREMIKGGYLFDADPQRIIQDPESLRASSVRQASAWRAWSRLRDSVVFQMNSSDHNPVVKVGMKPTDSWELATPQMMRFFVKGGPQSHGQSGYILSNANWDPYPLMNDVEAFSIALANMDVVVVNRMQRFSDAFFTVVKATDVLPNGGRGGSGGYTPVDIWQEIQSLAVPIAAEGNGMGNGVEELQAQSRLKTARARQLVSDSLSLVAFDLGNGAKWVDVRKAQDSKRAFGPGVEAAWASYRKAFPLTNDSPGGVPQNRDGLAIYNFLVTTPATGFASVPSMPAGETFSPVRW
jgi:histidine ammonia-lyase